MVGLVSRQRHHIRRPFRSAVSLMAPNSAKVEAEQRDPLFRKTGRTVVPGIGEQGMTGQFEAFRLNPYKAIIRYCVFAFPQMCVNICLYF